MYHDLTVADLQAEIADLEAIQKAHPVASNKSIIAAGLVREIRKEMERREG